MINGIIIVFSEIGTQIGIKWKTAGNVALSNNPISKRRNKAEPRDCLQANGTNRVKNEGIRTLFQQIKEININTNYKTSINYFFEPEPK